jgi:hypothetical protein
MPHYLIFHNPEKMGYSLDTVKDFTAFTNRKVKDENIGSKVWLITEEGRPRKYFLKMYFIIEDIKSDKEKNFKTKLIDSAGKRLNFMKRIDNLAWFDEFRKQMANFRGFAEIKQQKFIEELEKLA